MSLTTGPRCFLIFSMRFGLRFGCFARGKGLFKVLYDIVNVLCAHRNPDQILRDPAVSLLLVAELLVGGRPGVDS